MKTKNLKTHLKTRYMVRENGYGITRVQIDSRQPDFFLLPPTKGKPRRQRVPIVSIYHFLFDQPHKAKRFLLEQVEHSIESIQQRLECERERRQRILDIDIDDMVDKRKK